MKSKQRLVTLLVNQLEKRPLTKTNIRREQTETQQTGTNPHWCMFRRYFCAGDVCVCVFLVAGLYLYRV